MSRTCPDGAFCIICNEEEPASFEVFSLEERDELEEKVRQLTAAAASAAQAAVTALDRLILAEAVCTEARKFLDRQGNRLALYDAVLKWQEGRPS